jgi:hypothetical protein
MMAAPLHATDSKSTWMSGKSAFRYPVATPLGESGERWQRSVSMPSCVVLLKWLSQSSGVKPKMGGSPPES